ncbi:MAG: hypothetical protein ABR998_02600 [Gemmatimonadales bacterium]
MTSRGGGERIRSLVPLLLFASASAACYAYRTTAVAPITGTRVRIVLSSAAPITAMTPGREESRRTVAGVLEVRGRFEAGAADTLVVRLGELRTAAGAAPDVAEQVALVPTSLIARIDERRFQAGTTLLAGTGLAMIALCAFLVVIVATLTKAA